MEAKTVTHLKTRREGTKVPHLQKIGKRQESTRVPTLTGAPHFKPLLYLNAADFQKSHHAEAIDCKRSQKFSGSTNKRQTDTKHLNAITKDPAFKRPAIYIPSVGRIRDTARNSAAQISKDGKDGEVKAEKIVRFDIEHFKEDAKASISEIDTIAAVPEHESADHRPEFKRSVLRERECSALKEYGDRKSTFDKRIKLNIEEVLGTDEILLLPEKTQAKQNHTNVEETQGAEFNYLNVKKTKRSAVKIPDNYIQSVGRRGGTARASAVKRSMDSKFNAEKSARFAEKFAVNESETIEASIAEIYKVTTVPEAEIVDHWNKRPEEYKHSVLIEPECYAVKEYKNENSSFDEIAKLDIEEVLRMAEDLLFPEEQPPKENSANAEEPQGSIVTVPESVKHFVVEKEKVTAKEVSELHEVVSNWDESSESVKSSAIKECSSLKESENCAGNGKETKVSKSSVVKSLKGTAVAAPEIEGTVLLEKQPEVEKVSEISSVKSLKDVDKVSFSKYVAAEEPTTKIHEVFELEIGSLLAVTSDDMLKGKYFYVEKANTSAVTTESTVEELSALARRYVSRPEENKNYVAEQTADRPGGTVEIRSSQISPYKRTEVVMKTDVSDVVLSRKPKDRIDSGFEPNTSRYSQVEKPKTPRATALKRQNVATPSEDIESEAKRQKAATVSAIIASAIGSRRASAASTYKQAKTKTASVAIKEKLVKVSNAIASSVKRRKATRTSPAVDKAKTGKVSAFERLGLKEPVTDAALTVAKGLKEPVTDAALSVAKRKFDWSYFTRSAEFDTLPCCNSKDETFNRSRLAVALHLKRNLAAAQTELMGTTCGIKRTERIAKCVAEVLKNYPYPPAQSIDILKTTHDKKKEVLKMRGKSAQGNDRKYQTSKACKESKAVSQVSQKADDRTENVLKIARERHAVIGKKYYRLKEQFEESQRNLMFLEQRRKKDEKKLDDATKGDKM